MTRNAMTLRAGAAALVTMLVFSAEPASAQTAWATGGGGRLIDQDIEDGRMTWGAAIWNGRHTMQRGLDASAEFVRLGALRRLEERGGVGLYVEISGAVPDEITIRHSGREYVCVPIATQAEHGNVKGNVRAGLPEAGSIPIVFIRNNVQREIVIEVPRWLRNVTVVVNGRVVKEAVVVRGSD